MGCVLSAEIFKASFAFWDSDDYAIECFISLIENASNRLKQTLLQRRLSPAIQVLQESQGDAVHIMRKEIPRRTQEIPKIKLTEENIVDTLWNGPSCSICLQTMFLRELLGLNSHKMIAHSI
ncbi:hypothetical protein GH714_006870 [Hevea brasiliensis]|uniref:Uncharacterized protein n=1 Tax=Hevea brasiliensis TaxID=3981 RepID=A0A6A6L979_HEVBR|nr:hypothetical protein GH714_006870 [Hevea brasiliensis]